MSNSIARYGRRRDVSSRPSSNRQHPASKQSNKRPPKEPAIAKLPAGQSSHQAQERDYWGRQLRLARWLNGITLGAAIVGLVGLFFVYRQLVETHDAIARDNRAWIEPMSPVYSITPVKPGDRIGVFIPYDNVGKEPATDLKVFSRPFWIDNPSPPRGGRIDDLSIPINNTCDLASRSSQKGIIAWHARKNPMVYAAPELGTTDYGFFTGQKIFGYQGCFKYNSFGASHASEFCYLLTAVLDRPPAQWVWSVCPGNDQEEAD